MNKFLIWISIILLSSCVETKKDGPQVIDVPEVYISGIIKNGEDQLVTIDRMDPSAFVPVDSMRCNSKGEFEFNFHTAHADFFSLKYSDNGYITLIASPGDKIKITGSTDSIHPYTVDGSKESSLVRQLSVVHMETLESLKEISEKTNEIIGDPNYTEIKQVLNRKFDSITNSFHDYSTLFIREHSQSLSILIALYNQYGPRLPVFELPKDMDIFLFVDSTLNLTHPDNEAVKALHSQLGTVKQQLELQKKRSVLSVGMKAPDFVMTSSENNPLSLSELRGKYVLVQFWASWSKPSTDENIFLKNCFNKFQNSSFAILQVSIDNEREPWLQAIEEQELKWYHVSDLNRWESPAVDLYNVERIPANYLVNPNGVIVEKDIFGEEIERTVAKYLK